MLRPLGLLAGLVSFYITTTDACGTTPAKNLIVDTDLFSDVDDAGALLLAATYPGVNLLAVNVNFPSTYSALTASAILGHYQQSHVPVGIKRPLNDQTFFDGWGYELGEFTSKVAFHFSGGSLPWGSAEDAWDPVALYRKVLAEADNCSVAIASIGFFENLSGLLNSTADEYSPLTGVELVEAKVSELVVMGGGYPSGHSYNFWGDNPYMAAHVINGWRGRIIYIGTMIGRSVTSGGRLMREGPSTDPVRQAYIWYTYGNPRFSWDPLTVLYAVEGLGDTFRYGNEFGYNYVHPNGSNQWVLDEQRTDQFWLDLAVDNVTASERLDELYLSGVRSVLEASLDYGDMLQNQLRPEL